MSFTTLISTAALAPRLDDPAYLVIDCRFTLNDTEWGAREYRTAHIPRASYAHLDRDLSGAKSGTNGRHPLPSPDALAATFGRLGVTDGRQVVAYDQGNGMYASRLWWMLRWMGHNAAAVLDGGFAKWMAEGRPTRAGEEHRAPARFTPQPRHDMIVDAPAVAALTASPRSVLLDARAPARFRGELEPLDKIPGHIPGARNLFFEGNLDAQGTFLTPEALRERLRATIGETAAGDLVCYCGSGVTACHNLLALEHAGLKGAKLYPGSWSEWCSDATRPIATGE